MDWTQVMKGWTHFTNIVGAVRRAGARTHEFAENPIFTSMAADAEYAEERPKPYSPKGHRDRIESSLHLSS